MSNAVERRDTCRILAGKLEGERPHLEYTAIGEKVILKLILRKSFVGEGGPWTGLDWLRIRTVVEIF